jgi:predicted HTH domain antitoxin
VPLSSAPLQHVVAEAITDPAKQAALDKLHKREKRKQRAAQGKTRHNGVNAVKNSAARRRGTMSQIAMTIPDESLAALAESPELASAELRMLAAVKLFEMKKLSSGAAARLAGISRVEFLLRLGKYGVPVFDMTEEELERETRLA